MCHHNVVPQHPDHCRTIAKQYVKVYLHWQIKPDNMCAKQMQGSCSEACAEVLATGMAKTQVDSMQVMHAGVEC